jgi:hypothetical protein
MAYYSYRHDPEWGYSGSQTFENQSNFPSPPSNRPISRTPVSVWPDEQPISGSVAPQVDLIPAYMYYHVPQQNLRQPISPVGSSAYSRNGAAEYFYRGDFPRSPSMVHPARIFLELHSANRPTPLYQDPRAPFGVPASGGAYMRSATESDGSQMNQSTNWSSLTPSIPLILENRPNTFNSVMQSEFVYQESRRSHSPFPNGELSSTSTITADTELVGQVVEPMDGNITFPSQCPQCDDSTRIYDHVSAWYAHVWDKHPPNNTWEPRTCLWEGCTLPKKFKTHRYWLEHVRNVHEKSYHCAFPGCTVAPFGTQNMVTRHYKSTHAKPILCSKPGCQARKNVNLSRKDKLDDHEARWHGPLECEVIDCPRRRIDGEDYGFSEPSELERHMRLRHHYYASGPGSTRR